MKAPNESVTLPSRKSVNWAPQLKSNPPDKEKKPTIKRRSSRLRSSGCPTSKPGTECTFLDRMSNSKTHSTDDTRDEDLPIHFVSYLSDRRGTREHVPGSSNQAKEPTISSRAKPDMSLPTATNNASKVKSESGLGKRHRVPVGEETGMKSPIDDHKQRRKEWVSVPLDDMASKVENIGRNDRSACPEADRTCGRSSENETVKSEDDHIVEISKVISNVSEVLEESRKILKEKGKRDFDDNILPQLLKAVTSVKGFVCEVENMVQNLREGKQAEKAESEANAEAERHKLQDEITKLKQVNRTVLAEKLRVQRERNKLQKDYVGTLERAKNSLRLEIDRENAEVSAALANELAKEQEKNLCQICFTAPRDAVVLPCMHFQYCSECLQKHQKRSTDCPNCRGKISGVLRCNLSMS